MGELIPSPPGQFCNGRVDPREASAKSNTVRRLKRAALALSREKDIFEQVSKSHDLWQIALDAAARQADDGDPRMLFQMLQDATDRCRGRATQTQLVAIDHRIQFSPEELESARSVARELAGLPVEVTSVTVEAVASVPPADAEPGAVSSFPAPSHSTSTGPAATLGLPPGEAE